jgi:hypothetical protein
MRSGKRCLRSDQDLSFRGLRLVYCRSWCYLGWHANCFCAICLCLWAYVFVVICLGEVKAHA